MHTSEENYEAMVVWLADHLGLTPESIGKYHTKNDVLKIVRKTWSRKNPFGRDTLAVDFDGVLHIYTSPFTQPDVITDGPVPGAFQWLTEMDEHYSILIHSARLDTPSYHVTDEGGGAGFTATRDVQSMMIKWFLDHGLDENVVQRLRFRAKPNAALYIDDRGFRYSGGAFPSTAQIECLTPWTKK